MEMFKKLSREEMKNVMGGTPTPPACTVGALCNGVINGTITTGSCDANCSCTIGNSGARNDCSNLV